MTGPTTGKDEIMIFRSLEDVNNIYLDQDIPIEDGKVRLMRIAKHADGTSTFNYEGWSKTWPPKGFSFRRMPDIRNVIFNYPATVVIWDDGTKTVVKCGGHDEWDPEKGLAMAVAKKAMGNKGSYNRILKKWLKTEKV